MSRRYLCLGTARTRFVLILHDAVFHPGDSYLFRHTILSRQIHQTDALIVLSDHVKQQVMQLFNYPSDRIWSMPHAAFKFGSKAIIPATHPRGSRPLRLLFFGRIVAYKGLDRLLQAYRLLVRQYAIDLTIAGSGNLEPFAGLLDLAVNVVNRWLREDDVAALIAASDIVVLPYDEASQSGVAASAYAAGRPVVVTPIGGLVEQVQDTTGIIAKDMSVEAFAAAIAKFADEPCLLDCCAEGALAYAQNSLSWERSAQVVDEVCSAVVTMPRRSK